MWNFTSVRLRVRVFAVLLAALILLPFTVQGAAAATVSVTGTYKQSEARKVLDMINNFRQSSDAWYWNENNTEKVQLTGLGKLTYDYGLEKIAMQRAAEIAVKFSHTRPNGQDCFSLTYNGIQSYGENIAYGQSSDEAAFIAFREDNEDYSGQGHRRNMLRAGYTSVGLAHFVVNGRDYYVQEFGYSNSGTGSTSAVNGTTTVEVETQDTSSKLSVSLGAYSGITISYSGQAPLPTVSLIETSASQQQTTIDSSKYSVSWASNKTSVVTISGSNLVAVGIGDAKLTATVKYGNQTLTADYNVTVKAADLSGLSFGSIPDQTYHGSPIELSFDLSVNGIGLQKDKDYTISYQNNNGPGTASFTITGKGNYTGSKTVTFKIVSDGSQAPQPTKIPTTPPTGTPTPTKEPTKAPTATNTPAPTKTPTKAPTKAPTATPSPKPAKTPTPKPTNTPIPKATNTPIPTVTPVPTEEPSPTPEATPTEEPVPTEELTPTPAEELTPTGELTPTPAEEITPTAGPTPTEGVPGIPSPDGPEDNPPGEVSNPPSGETPGEYDQTLLLPPENSVADKGGAEAEITEDSAGGSSGGKPEFVWLYALIPAALIGAVITGTVLVLRKRG